MKIGILYVCTGKYHKFFEDFYESSEKFFLTEAEKHYYVWTDSELSIFNKPNITKIYQPKLGWPMDTMMRFHMFNDNVSILENNDYLFFLNANMIFMNFVGEEVLADLVGVKHPNFWNKPPVTYPYERNPSSQFYIPFEEGRIYFQGCFNGGKTGMFLEMSRILADKLEIDSKNGIVPIWHDESALNWYYCERDVLPLGPEYAFPELFIVNSQNIGWMKQESNLFMPILKILQKDKMLSGGHEYLRK